MLIRFYLNNFLSFSENTEFSMISGKGLSLNTDQIINNKEFSILKGALLYGANASGKSNFIKSLSFAKRMVINLNQKGMMFPDNRFKLDKKYSELPTKFEFEIINSNKVYAYGFVFFPDKILEEWLYIINGEKETLVFERKEKEFILNNKIINNKEEYDRLKFMFVDLFENQLYLTAVNNRNIKDIKTATDLINVYNWFDKKLIILFPESRFNNWQIIEKDETFRNFMKNMLSAFDTGICDIKFEKKDLIEIKKEIPEEIIIDIESKIPNNKKIMFTDSDYNNRYIFYKENNELKAMELRTTHTSPDCNISFKITNESDGTKRLTDFLPLFINLSSKERVIIIDEIDRSLHTEITYKLLEIFLHKSGKNNSQLIVTTHDTGLLDLNLIRKDEIWFAEKDKTGGSKLYSLYEFKPRNDLNIQKGYLAGRFGAIPFISQSIDTFLKEMSE